MCIRDRAYTGWEYPADQAVNLYPDIIFYDEGIDPEYFKGTQVYNCLLYTSRCV